MRPALRILICLALTQFSWGQDTDKKAFFQAPPNSVLTATDLHIHTVFSDGSVWPNIRVDEALREGLDLIALTEHLEYQPHSRDLPHPDRNRSFEIAQGHLGANKNLRVVNGSEITRSMAPGHINAVFIENANALLHKDSLSGIVAANKQDAFVFWNHPDWPAQRLDGIARLEPFHEYLIKNKLLHGIEVVNEHTFSEEALELALKHKLTILGTSDIHGLIDWTFKIPEGGHRPMTFVWAENDSNDAIKKSLKNRKTIVWYKDLLIGEAAHIAPVLLANLTGKSMGYEGKTLIANVQLNNLSALPMQLDYLGDYSFLEHGNLITLPPYSSLTLRIRTRNKEANLLLPFRVRNVMIGAKTNPVVPIKVVF